MRRFLIITGAVIVAYAAWQWVGAVRAHQRLNWAIDAKTIVLACDLSKPGKYTGTLEQAYGGHLYILVVAKSPFEKEGEAKASLAGLRTKLVVRNQSGLDEVDIPLTADWAFERINPGGRPESGWNFQLEDNGSYQLELDVLQPAKALAGRQHHIEGRYHSLSLESGRWFVNLRYGWAGLLTLVGGGACLGGLIIGKRLGKNPEANSPTEPASRP